MKKLFIIAMSALMVLAMVACTKKPVEEPVKEPEQKQEEVVDNTEKQDEPMVGAWEAVAEKEVSDELKAMFEGVVGEGYEFQPVELVAKQVVSGTNYLLRCVNEAGEEKLIGIYQNLEGVCELLDEASLPTIDEIRPVAE